MLVGSTDSIYNSGLRIGHLPTVFPVAIVSHLILGDKMDDQ